MLDHAIPWLLVVTYLPPKSSRVRYKSALNVIRLDLCHSWTSIFLDYPAWLWHYVEDWRCRMIPPQRQIWSDALLNMCWNSTCHPQILPSQTFLFVSNFGWLLMQKWYWKPTEHFWNASSVHLYYLIAKGQCMFYEYWAMWIAKSQCMFCYEYWAMCHMQNII